MRAITALQSLFLLSCICLDAQADRPTSQPVSPASGGKVYSYKTTKEGELQIEVFFPPDWKTSDERPAIVFFFGGAWRFGERAQFYTPAKYFASRGMVAATADYRIGSRHHTAPDKCVEDAKSAIRWVRAHAAELGADPARIIASGGSAGGHIAACTALCPGFEMEDEDLAISSKPQALVLFNPVLDLSAVTTLMERLPGNDQDRGKAIGMMSPAQHLTKNAPPTILFFGSEDPLLSTGVSYFNLASQLGAPVEMYLAEKQRHGFFNWWPWNHTVLRQVDEFLASLGYLEGKPNLVLSDQIGLKKIPPQRQ